MKKYLIIGLILLTCSLQIAEASYSFRVVVKYPFITEHYIEDSLGNIIVISDSLVRFMPINGIIFKTETESLYQQSVTNDSGYAVFTFEKWKDDTLITPVAMGSNLNIITNHGTRVAGINCGGVSGRS